MLNNSDIHNGNKYNMNNNNGKRDDKINTNKFELRRNTNRIRAKENNNNLNENNINNNINNRFNNINNKNSSIFNMSNNEYISTPKNTYMNNNIPNNNEEKIEIECICSNNIYSKFDMIQCLLCNKYQHISCIFKAKDILPYVCFNCQFKNNHFYLKWKKTILSAKEVIYKKQWEDNKKELVEGTKVFQFYLDLNELDSKYNKDGNNSHYIVFLWLTNNGRPFQLGFPDNVKIEINNKKFFLTDNKGFKRPLLLAIDNSPFYTPKKRALITSDKFEIPHIKDYFITPKNPSYKEKNIQKITISFEDLLENYHGSEFEYEAQRHYLFYVGLFQEIKIPMLKNCDDLKQYHEAFKNLYNEKVKKLNWNKVSKFVTGGYDEMNMSLISNVSNQKILHPIRGLFCHHSDVLDYGECCGYITSNSQVYKCFKCYKPLNIMYIDDMSEKIFNKYKNENYSQIYYTNKFKFIRGEQIAENKEKSEKKNDEENNEEEEDSLSDSFFEFYDKNKFKDKSNDYDNDENNNDNNANQVIELNSSSDSIEEQPNNQDENNIEKGNNNGLNSENNYFENENINNNQDINRDREDSFPINSFLENSPTNNNQRKEFSGNDTNTNYRDSNINNESVNGVNNINNNNQGEVIVLEDDEEEEDDDINQNLNRIEKECNNILNQQNSNYKFNDKNMNENKINRNKILRDNTINNKKNNSNHNNKEKEKEKERQDIFGIYTPQKNKNSIIARNSNENDFLGKKRQKQEMKEKEKEKNKKNKTLENDDDLQNGTSIHKIKRKKLNHGTNPTRKSQKRYENKNKKNNIQNSEFNDINRNDSLNNSINYENSINNNSNNNINITNEDNFNNLYNYSSLNNKIPIYSEEINKYSEEKKNGTFSEIPSSSNSYLSNNSYKKSSNKKIKNKKIENDSEKNLPLENYEEDETGTNNYLFGNGREENMVSRNKNGIGQIENKKKKNNNKNNNKEINYFECDNIKLKPEDFIEVRPYDEYKKLMNERSIYEEENNDEVYLNDIKVFELKHRQNEFINFDYFNIQRKLREFCASKEQSEEIFEANKKFFNLYNN